MDYANLIRQKVNTGSKKEEKLLQQLLVSLSGYMPSSEIKIVVRAYEYGAKAHINQRRLSGEPYICHPLSVAQILANMQMDNQTISAALLHDVIEDTDINLIDLENIFNKEIAILVDSVSKLDQIKFNNRAEAQAETFRKMILAMVEDIRVIFIKLSDRLHNMRTLEHLPAQKRKLKAKETLDIYAPIANRLGINKIKNELEEFTKVINLVLYVFKTKAKVAKKEL